MAITDKDSVLILGAGASVTFGLPLGGQLMEDIRKLASDEIYRLTMAPNPFDPNLIKRDNQARTRVGNTLITKSLMGDIPVAFDPNVWQFIQARAIEPIESLVRLLTGQTSETIDDFIALNPAVSHITKIGIAAVFFRRLYGKKGDVWTLQNLSSRQTKTDRRNWVHHLINLVRHNKFDLEGGDLPTKVRVISFNYDGILETTFEDQFNNTGHNFGDWRDYIEIVHPHGFMGILEQTIDDPIALVLRWADAIDVVKEPDPSPNVEAARSTAQAWIQEARKVYMAGFAVSGPNARLLGLGHRLNNSQVWNFLNFDGSPGLRRAVHNFERKQSLQYFIVKDDRRHFPGSAEEKHMENLGGVTIKDPDVQQGSRSDHLHIDHWFTSGIPGELPS